jgi:transcriptional regulator with PAS, ATPase and Fis domain
MATLIADRFLFYGAPTAAQDLDIAVIDLATGERVRLHIASAGAPSEQHTWADACARAYHEGRLVDYGVIGIGHRFEARGPRGGLQRFTRTPPSDGLLQWLDCARPTSTRVLYVEEMPDLREVRLRGFVPCLASLLQDASLALAIWPLLAKRSVALLNSRAEPSSIVLTLLRLRRLCTRDVCVISQRQQSKHKLIANAAEKQPHYGKRPAVPDMRVTQMMGEADRLLLRGRHCAAERALRAAIAAFDRRADWCHAGDAGITLGRLLLSRGRAAHARDVFEDAHNYFQRAHAADHAIDATTYVGLAQTDLAAAAEGGQTCRAAYSAAIALRRPESILFAGNAFVRNLFWHERYAEARAVLDSLVPAGDVAQCTRYWCLAARLHIAARQFTEARQALERARPMTCGMAPELESTVRLCEAALQARLGDLDAVRLHVVAGLTASRTAHLPLQTIKLKLVHVEGLITAERFSAARTSAKHLKGLRDGRVPPLLRLHVESVLKGLDRVSSAREPVARFQVADAACGIAELDSLRDLLALSHQFDDETDALSRAATAVRKQIHAAGVAIFTSHGNMVSLVGSAGSTNEAVAQRAINAGQRIVPQIAGGWIEAAVPVQYLGRVIGAMAFRWNIEGPDNIERALAFGSAAAAICAPLVYVLVERRHAPAVEHAEFDLVGVSAAMTEVRKAIARAANAPFTVLVEGESGSGKELVARAIHFAGCRRERRFCAFNCAAMPEDLIDAELFGHAKGAFTGAAAERLGLFESADGGTVFLDEISELSARAQAKVLRVLQEGEIRRIGEHFTRPFDARLLAATNRPLRTEVEARRFRQDLLYRLDVIRIHVPPLRDRVEDIPLLAARFWRQAAERIGSKAVLGQSALSALARYDWPGNVRELQNVLTALVVAAPARGVVGETQLPQAIARATQLSAEESLESARLKFEQRFVRAALARAAGHRGRTAAALGLSRQGLAKLMQRLHLDD